MKTQVRVSGTSSKMIQLSLATSPLSVEWATAFIRKDHWNQGQNLALTTREPPREPGRMRLSGTILRTGRHGALFGPDAVFRVQVWVTGACLQNCADHLRKVPGYMRYHRRNCLSGDQGG
jgi:hypothetical protein